MSSFKRGENPLRRKSKVSWGRFVRPGVVGPKARPKGVVDGQQVNIPALRCRSEGVTQQVRPAVGWKRQSKRAGRPAGKSAGQCLRRDGTRRPRAGRIGLSQAAGKNF